MVEAVNIKINMDKKCVRCMEPGALETGYCMKCAAKLAFDMAVGPRTLDAITAQISELFRTYQRKLNQSIKINGNELNVSFRTEIKLIGNQVAVQTEIDFIAEKIKDKAEIATVSEIQGGLFE